MLRREVDTRDWPQFEQTGAVTGNYYPVVAAIQIADEQHADEQSMIEGGDADGANSNDGPSQFVVLTDVAQGGEIKLKMRDAK
jgi:hypothetical protein